LASPFVVQCFQSPDEIKENELINEFKDYVGDYDTDIFINLLNHFSHVNEDDNMHVLSEYDVRARNTKDNVKLVQRQVAHKMLIQTPSFVAKCWAPVFKNLVKPKDPIMVLSKMLIPTNKKVLLIFKFPTEIENNKTLKPSVMLLKSW